MQREIVSILCNNAIHLNYTMDNDKNFDIIRTWLQNIQFHSMNHLKM